MTSANESTSEPSGPSSPQRTYTQMFEACPPALNSTRLEVEMYLTAYFRYSQSLTKEAALEKAKQLPVDGQTLYGQHVAKLQALFGPTGGSLYDDIHTSSYGMVRLMLTILSFIFH